jgi:chromosome segregation ATPase
VQTAANRRELGDQSVYKELRDDLSSMDTTAKALTGFIHSHWQLEKQGFDEKIATAFAKELTKMGLTTEEAARELAHALEKHRSLDEAVSAQEREKRKLGDEVSHLREELDTVRDLIEAGRTQVRALKEAVGTLRSTSRNLNESIKKAGRDAKKSMNTMVKSTKTAVRSVKGAAHDSLMDTVGKLNADVLDSKEKFSQAAKDVETKAANANRVMDALTQEAFDLGREIEGLEPISRTYRFISKGEGEPNEAILVAVDFMEQLSKWEKDHIGPHRTYTLDRAIQETKENWASLRKK